ncbi:CHASE domain-containing protein [Altererythrobacter sp. BO-6]|uniref:CHASE domain-containing protein n=1 Tax=Altererythrobacter sp. BO-6 TaxID=2604537 RepID=UPI001F49911B|nr:CHASE domain-containing protein [Altererythrobacter sp. BO-6]
MLAIEASEEQHDRAVMGEVAQSVSSALERRGDTSAAYLRAGSALFTANSEVSQSLFRSYANELQLDVDAGGSEGIGWAEVVSLAELDDFERQVRVERDGPFEVRREPGAGADLMVPVTFFKPDTEGSRRAIGFDLYSEPARRAAMDEAAQLLRPTGTGKLMLLRTGEREVIGFLVFMPVFETIAGERRLKGFIFSPFDAQYFLESAMRTSAHPYVGVRLYDGAASPENLLATHAPAAASGKVIHQRIQIANRPLLIEIESSRQGILSPLSMATLLFGLAVASLLMMLARLLTRQAIEDEASLAFFEEQNSIRNSLTRELNHRVKNTLASILSIISLTRRRTNDLDEFAEGLEGRVRALSATHDLLTQSDWGTTPVRSVIEAELAPYAGVGADAEIVIEGPDIQLSPNDALSLGLAVHELTTNAAKYGALSQPGGKVTAQWEYEGEELVVVRWQERGGPPVSPERKKGFGTELIQKIVAHELRQPVDLRFEAEGVSCTLRVPIRVRREFQIREKLNRLAD